MHHYLSSFYGEIPMNTTSLPVLRRFGVPVLALFIASILSSCAKDVGTSPSDHSGMISSPIPISPGEMKVPSNNPMYSSIPAMAQQISAKIELGRHLFYDKNMSVDRTTSCASCHSAQMAFSDIVATSKGFQGQHGTRNAPGLSNVGFNTAFTWDGRFKTLEEHVPGPIFNSLEMGNNLRNPNDSSGGNDTLSSGYNSKPGNNDTLFLFKRLSGTGSDVNGITYADLFKAAWGDPKISMDRIAKSIASFERTILSATSSFDKYNKSDQSAISESAKQGYQIFIDPNKANCVSCHAGYNFTDQKFHDNGIGSSSVTDQGRFNITKIPSDAFKFKTPTLRNITLTGPYMHDGRFSTITEVISHYNSGGKGTQGQDPAVKKLNLSTTDVANIIEFLKTLQDDKFTSNEIFRNPWQ